MPLYLLDPHGVVPYRYGYYTIPSQKKNRKKKKEKKKRLTTADGADYIQLLTGKYVIFHMLHQLVDPRQSYKGAPDITTKKITK